MALRSKSLFLYGYQVTRFNSSLDFKVVSGGPVLQATIRLGYYSLSSLLNEIVRAMQVADPDHIYVATADRTLAGGLQNRVTISTDDGTYLDLMFLTGPRVSSSIAQLIGFNPVDRTGALTYTGNFSSGTGLVTTEIGYNFLAPHSHKKVFGSVNVASSGKKESIVFNIQQFVEVQFKYEPEAKLISEWTPFMEWSIQQKLFDFTPNLSIPNTFYEVTFEKTGEDGKGLGFKMSEMLPNYPDFYETGMLQFRINQT